MPYDDDSFDDLDNFGGDACKAEHAFTAGLDTIPDGDYEGEFLSAELTRAKELRIVRCKLRLGGRAVQYVFWLSNQSGINSFLADLKTLGFPADDWGSRAGQSPLSVMIPDSVKKLKGMKFHATKVHSKDERPGYEDRTYHKLLINQRLHSGMRLEENLPHRPTKSAPRTKSASPQEADIPFSIVPWIGAIITLGSFLA